MREQAAGGMKPEVAQAGISRAGEERLPALPQRRVRVHAAAVVLEDRLRHERHRLAVPLRDVLADVLVPHELIGHFQQWLKLHVDLGLSGGGDFVVMRFDDDADLAHLVHHLAAQIVIGVGGTHREIAALEAWLVPEVRLFVPRRVPRAFSRIDLVVPAMLVLLVPDLVKDEELGFGADEAGVGDAALLEVRLGLACDVSRVAREVLARDRIDHVGDHAERGAGKEGIESSRVGDRHRHHVGFVDAHPASDRRAVEPETLLERPFIEVVEGKGAVLPGAEHVDEFQVDHLGLILLAIVKKIAGCLGKVVRGHLITSTFRQKFPWDGPEA